MFAGPLDHFISLSSGLLIPYTSICISCSAIHYLVIPCSHLLKPYPSHWHLLLLFFTCHTFLRIVNHTQTFIMLNFVISIHILFTILFGIIILTIFCIRFCHICHQVIIHEPLFLLHFSFHYTLSYFIKLYHPFPYLIIPFSSHTLLCT